MITGNIESVKEFMQGLFNGDMFDRFHVSSCMITTFVEYSIDGKYNKNWFENGEKDQEASGLITWLEIKPMVYQMIRGHRTPEKMKIDFCHYMPDGDVASIRIEYQDDQLRFYTGYMQKEFTLNKEKQQEWDENCLLFFKKNQIISNLV